MKQSLLIKLILGLGAAALFGFLFTRSLHDTRTTPYTVERQHVRGWTLMLEPASKTNDPLLVLQPTPELASGLFREVFSRAMESLNAPVRPAIPVVLRGEFDRDAGDGPTHNGLLTAARAAGLESSNIVPRCLVHRRVSEPGGTRQVYFVLFDAPAVSQFRRQIGLDPAALSPILFIAAAGPDFNSWLPQRVSPESDCLAPVEIAD